MRYTSLSSSDFDVAADAGPDVDQSIFRAKSVRGAKL